MALKVAGYGGSVPVFLAPSRLMPLLLPLQTRVAVAGRTGTGPPPGLLLPDRQETWQTL